VLAQGGCYFLSPYEGEVPLEDFTYRGISCFSAAGELSGQHYPQTGHRQTHV